MKKLVLAMFAVLSFTFYSMAADGYAVGSAVSDFKLQNVDGKTVSLSDYKDVKGLIVTFTCNHCPYAKAYEDRIIALNNKYASKGFPVVAINSNDAAAVPEDNFDNMKMRAKEKNYTFPYLYDESQEQAKKFGATRTPHIFIVQKEGKEFVVRYIGAIDDNWEDASAVKEKYAENATDALLNGKAVAVTNTKAIGCTIKWKK